MSAFPAKHNTNKNGGSNNTSDIPNPSSLNSPINGDSFMTPPQSPTTKTSTTQQLLAAAHPPTPMMRTNNNNNNNNSDISSTANTTTSDTTPLPPITSIWDCTNINKCKVKRDDEDKDGWKCGWCGSTFTTIHATRAQWHVLKMSGMGINVCKEIIPDAYLQRYRNLYEKKGSRPITKRKQKRKREEAVIDQEQSASINSGNDQSIVSTTTDHEGQKSSVMEQTDMLMKLMDAMEKTSSMITKSEEKVKELKAQKHELESNNGNIETGEEKLNKLDSKIRLEENMVKAYMASLQVHTNNLDKLNKEGVNNSDMI